MLEKTKTNFLQGREFVSFSDGTRREFKILSVIGDTVKVESQIPKYTVFYSVTEVHQQFILGRWQDI